jgi:hypothetical protein
MVKMSGMRLGIDCVVCSLCCFLVSWYVGPWVVASQCVWLLFSLQCQTAAPTPRVHHRRIASGRLVQRITLELLCLLPILGPLRIGNTEIRVDFVAVFVENRLMGRGAPIRWFEALYPIWGIPLTGGWSPLVHWLCSQVT